jgi:hypothetical protein
LHQSYYAPTRLPFSTGGSDKESSCQTTDRSGGRDRKLINLDQAHEVRDWAKKFGVSEDELRKAGAAVGNEASKVEAHLKARKK